MSAQWRIAFFGGLKACQTGQEFFRFRTQKAGAMLALLAYPPHQVYSRDKLIEAFWPDTDLDHARHLLSQTLFSLRQRLELSGIPADSLLLADHARV